MNYVALNKNKTIRLYYLKTFEIVEKGTSFLKLPNKILKIYRSFLAFSTLMYALDPQKKSLVTFYSGGQISLMQSIANNYFLKGFIDLDLTKNIVYNNSILKISKSMQLKTSYETIFKINNNPIATEVARYFKQSDGIRSFYLEWYEDKKSAVIFLQSMPNATLKEFVAAKNLIKAHKNIINKPKLFMNNVLKETPLINEIPRIEYRCEYNKKYYLNKLLFLPDHDFYDLIENHPKLTVDCEFCQKKYTFLASTLIKLKRNL